MKYRQLVSMPAAVSNWLEEQLEARGIDAVVYTRYILSLLHSDTVDVIYSDEDLQFSHLKKEVRRSGGTRKRLRRSSGWWQSAEAAAEKLKRTAAVECLMSAAEQSCGIESLIDELCEKLNEVNSEASAVDTPIQKTNPELIQHVSPQESAKRYYDAFPPLNRNSSPSKLISLLPKWLPSPKKHRKHDDKMKTSRAMGKQRFGVYLNGRSNSKKEMARIFDNNLTTKKSRNDDTVPKSHDEDWTMGDDDDDDDVNLYDDLPVDIKELLDDEPNQDVTVAIMNLANMRDTGRRGFIPCGTNIKSSIWTNEAAMEQDNSFFDNNFNSAIDSDSILDFQFSSISINNNRNNEFSFIEDNECNTIFENTNTKIWERWSADDGGSLDDDHFLNNQFTLSLVKLNHNKEVSAFAELKPNNRQIQYNRFSKVIGSGLHRDTSLKTIDLEMEKDDLLTSVRSHFRPINEKLDTYLHGQYADGATFIVSNNWDKINYKRTESGALYMENDYSMRKKYCEYKVKNQPAQMEFVLKYLVCQNDKGCQTEIEDAEVEAINSEENAKKECTCRILSTNSECNLHPFIQETSEVVWQEQSCKDCDQSTPWKTPINNDKDLEWQFGTLSNIWSGGEVCHSCLGRPTSTIQNSKLREDVSQDGDQLLSDLSSIQKSYMQESTLPITESTCDITDFLLPKERKRRHSLLNANPLTNDSWSFASRLEEDCLIQLSSIPTLRSVIL